MKTTKLLISIFGVALLIFIGPVLPSLGMPADAVKAVLGGIITVLLTVLEVIEERKKTDRQKIDEFLAGGDFANPWYIAFFFLSVMFVLPRLFTFPAYWTVVYKFGWEYFPKGAFASPAMQSGLALVQGTASAWLLIFVSAPILALVAKRMAHRIKRNSALYLSGSVLLNQIISMLLLVGYLYTQSGNLMQITPEMLKEQLILACFLMIPVWIGCVWAKHTQAGFVMGEFFRKLKPDHQQTVLSIIKMQIDQDNTSLTENPPSSPPVNPSGSVGTTV